MSMNPRNHFRSINISRRECNAKRSRVLLTYRGERFIIPLNEFLESEIPAECPYCEERISLHLDDILLELARYKENMIRSRGTY